MKRNSRGDTIIEVMFAMAIIGVVLAAAYATASKNLQTSQLTKERTQAANIAEAQLEQLKILAEEPTASSFCIDISAANVIIDASDPNNCIESYYKKTITKTDNKYKILVEWVPAGGLDTNKANVTLYYSDYNFAQSGSNNLSIATESSNALGVTLSVSIRNESSILSSGIVYGIGTNPRLGDGASVALPSDPTSADFDILVSLAKDPNYDPALIYYGRAYVNTPNGVFFSTPIRFSGTTPIGPQVAAPSISNISAAAGALSATVTGLISDGGSAVTSRTLTYYRLNNGGNPTGQQTITLNSNNILQTLSTLQPGIQYYFTITATNVVGTTTSTVRNFTTNTIPTGVVQAGERTDTGTGKASRYYLSNDSVTCLQARQVAANSGGHLVTLGSAAENNFVAAFAGTYIWIGYNDIATEGNWQWTNGEAKVFEAWYDNPSTPEKEEPNDYQNGVPGEDCAVMNWTGPGTWNDLYTNGEFGYTARYVIEYELN